MGRYLVFPSYVQTWGDIFEYVYQTQNLGDADFIGCRTFKASTGKLVIKFPEGIRVI